VFDPDCSVSALIVGPGSLTGLTGVLSLLVLVRVLTLPLSLSRIPLVLIVRHCVLLASRPFGFLAMTKVCKRNTRRDAHEVQKG
jgi:hypothetical protein